ncbi:IS5 family transposase [Streptomyces griseofuscus]|uniref:IS5 family transposase n=1 Tax=Streptomyces griseofuscus TaxID=146922 RepID=UPI00378E1BB9
MSLSDAQWARIAPLLPDRTPKRGGRWRDHRRVIEAIAWKRCTGSPWRDMPGEYGSWKGIYTRLRNWAIDGTWERVFSALLARADADGDLDWVVSVDSTVVRAHQDAAGARQKAALDDEPPPCRVRAAESLVSRVARSVLRGCGGRALVWAGSVMLRDRGRAPP